MRPLLLVLLLASSACGQIDAPAESDPYVISIASCEVPAAGESGSVQYLWEADQSTSWLPVDDGRVVHFTAPPGPHYLKVSIFSVDWEARTFRVTQGRHDFRIRGQSPQPEPPAPDPQPDPDPAPPSKVTAVLIHESADDTPALAQMVVGLRTGEAARWLSAGGHSLLVLDDDATDSAGQPLQLVTTLKALGVQMPALFVLDGARVLLKESLPSTATAAEVLAKIQGVAQ